MANDTMSTSFSITAKTRSFQLDAEGKGVCQFTVTNTGKSALEGRVRLTPTGQNPAMAEWLTIAEPTEQSYQPNEERAYTVAIEVPKDAPGGTYLFRAEAYSVANPNDDYVGGPEFSFTLAREGEAQKKSFPLWIPITGLALVVAIAALVAVFLIPRAPVIEQTTVPVLVGLEEEAAKEQLHEAHLVVGNVEIKPTDDAAPGKIIGQGYQAGEKVDVNTPISLEIAAKPDAPLATVPDLVGKTLTVAQGLITRANLKAGVIGEKVDGAGAPGTVVQQVPAAGTQIGQGSEISFLVKAQPTPTEPSKIAWHGVLKVRQTWSGDIDSGNETDRSTAQNADFFFEAVTATQRYIVPKNGAVFAFTNSGTLEDCQAALAKAPQTRIDVARLKVDQLIAVRTNLGRYALVTLASPVGPSPGTLELRYHRFLIRVLPERPVIDLKTIRTVQPLQKSLEQPLVAPSKTLPTKELRTLPTR